MASPTALAVQKVTQPLQGIGAVLYRISSKKQEIQSQYESVGNWLDRRKAKVTHTFEFVVKRRKTSEHLDFKRFIDWVASGRINWVVVQDLDRFGSKDPYQLMGFLGQLRDHGCQLWSVADDKCLNDGADDSILIACIKGMTSEKECWTKSDRAHRSKQDLALEGRWLGGPIPYGFDVECRRDGRIVWRYVLESALMITEVVKGHPTKRYQFTGTLVQEGTEVKADGVPPRNRKAGEFAYLVPSIRVERIEAIKQIFAWYTQEEATAFEIAKRLNARGISPVHGVSWYAEKVKHIVRNPLYKGLPSAYKKTQSGYYRYAGIDPETGTRLMGKAIDKSGKGGRYSPEEWVSIRQPLEAIVSAEVADSAFARTDRPDPRPKSPKNPALWLSGLVVCGRCGAPMAGSAGHPDPKRKVTKMTYLCSTYAIRRECRAHRTQHDLIVKYVNDYLTSHDAALAEYKEAHRHPDRLKALVERDAEVGRLLADYADRIYRSLTEAGVASGSMRKANGRYYDPTDPQDRFEAVVDLPAMLAFYEDLAEQRRGTLEDRIKAKESTLR